MHDKSSGAELCRSSLAKKKLDGFQTLLNGIGIHKTKIPDSLVYAQLWNIWLVSENAARNFYNAKEIQGVELHNSCCTTDLDFEFE